MSSPTHDARVHPERPKLPHHTRFKSYTKGTAPVLSTEARAHRRSGSLSHVLVQSGQAVPAPPLSEYYSRSPLSRFATASSTAPAVRPAPNSTATMLPRTPAKKSLRRSSSLQHSPFSDYFTDSNDSASVHSNAPSSDTKQLLLRMNKLQSQLMRNSSREAINSVGRKLGEMELELDALHSHKRARPEVEDSGVFMDEDGDSIGVAPHSRHISMQSSVYTHSSAGDMDLPAQPVTLEQHKAERDWFVIRMQDLVDGLTAAQSELSKRYVEVRELNERHNVEMEEREMQLEQLRSENEGLRSDLGFEYSELLFLKLQMKSLEVDVDAVSEDSDFESLQPWTQQTRRERKNRILSEMDRWRSDWQDVNSRFKRRRSKYGVTPDRRDSVSTCSDTSSSGEVDWHLETVREGRKGRVTSLTIRRTSSRSAGAMTEDVAHSTCESDSSNTAQSEQPFPKDTQADLEGRHNNQGFSEPQIAEKNHVYTEHGTQTEPGRREQEGSRDEEEVEGKDEEADSLEAMVGPEYEDHAEVKVAEEQDLDGEDVETQDEDEIEDGDQGEDDCAITTSSEDTYDVEEEDEVEFQEPITTVRPKTAWQELWASLHNLSGLGEEEDDDEDD